MVKRLRGLSMPCPAVSQKYDNAAITGFHWFNKRVITLTHVSLLKLVGDFDKSPEEEEEEVVQRAHHETVVALTTCFMRQRLSH